MRLVIALGLFALAQATLKSDLALGQTGLNVDLAFEAVKVLNHRMEAAVAMNAGKIGEEAEVWVLTEIVHRAMCTSKVLESQDKEWAKAKLNIYKGPIMVPDKTPEEVDEQKTIERRAANLFQLPGNDAEMRFDEFNGDRTGAFLSVNNAARGVIRTKAFDELRRVVSKDGIPREMLTLLDRMAGGAEKTPFVPFKSKYAQAVGAERPGSLRHVIAVALARYEALKNDPNKLNLFYTSLQTCRFSLEHAEHQWRNQLNNPGQCKKKPLFTMIQGNWVNGAREMDGENGLTFRKTKSFPFAAGKLTRNILKQMHQADLTSREIAFVKSWSGAKNKNALGMDDILPQIPGASIWDMTKNNKNELWLRIMDEDAMSVNAGPSGTTDEAFQSADYFSISHDWWGACTMREAIFQNMILYTHHSFAEIAQGAMGEYPPQEGDLKEDPRATPPWVWDKPYDTYFKCADAKTKLKPVEHPGWKTDDLDNEPNANEFLEEDMEQEWHFPHLREHTSSSDIFHPSNLHRLKWKEGSHRALLQRRARTHGEPPLGEPGNKLLEFFFKYLELNRKSPEYVFTWKSDFQTLSPISFGNQGAAQLAELLKACKFEGGEINRLLTVELDPFWGLICGAAEEGTKDPSFALGPPDDDQIQQAMLYADGNEAAVKKEEDKELVVMEDANSKALVLYEKPIMEQLHDAEVARQKKAEEQLNKEYADEEAVVKSVGENQQKVDWEAVFKKVKEQGLEVPGDVTTIVKNLVDEIAGDQAKIVKLIKLETITEGGNGVDAEPKEKAKKESNNNVVDGEDDGVDDGGSANPIPETKPKKNPVGPDEHDNKEDEFIQRLNHLRRKSKSPLARVFSSRP